MRTLLTVTKHPLCLLPFIKHRIAGAGNGQASIQPLLPTHQTIQVILHSDPNQESKNPELHAAIIVHSCRFHSSTELQPVNSAYIRTGHTIRALELRFGRDTTAASQLTHQTHLHSRLPSFPSPVLSAARFVHAVTHVPCFHRSWWVFFDGDGEGNNGYGVRYSRSVGICLHVLDVFLFFLVFQGTKGCQGRTKVGCQSSIPATAPIDFHDNLKFAKG